MNRPILSFLRAKRFARTGNRGMSLIELAIVVGLIIAVAAVILLTTGDRASAIRLEALAGQTAGVVQLERTKITAGISRTQITADDLATRFNSAFENTDELTTFAGATRTAAACTGSAGSHILVTTTNLSADEVDTLAGAMQVALRDAFDGSGANYGQVFSDGVTPADGIVNASADTALTVVRSKANGAVATVDGDTHIRICLGA